jgi:hypothetical protein
VTSLSTEKILKDPVINKGLQQGIKIQEDAAGVA